MQIPGCFVQNEREAGSFESNCSGGQVFLFGFLGFNLKSAPCFFHSEVTKKCTFLHLGRRSRRREKMKRFIPEKLAQVSSILCHRAVSPRAPSRVRTPRPRPLPSLLLLKAPCCCLATNQPRTRRRPGGGGGAGWKREGKDDV